MKKFFIFLMVFAILLTLQGCRVEFKESLVDSTDANGEVEGNMMEVAEAPNKKDSDEINTMISIVGNVEGSLRTKLEGKSNLPEGAVLSVQIQLYVDRFDLVEENVTQGEIPTGPVVFEKDIVVEEGGDFNLTYLRREAKNIGKLTLTFRPERQPDKLKKVYGEFGENISNNKNSITNVQYTIDGKEYRGYQVYAVIGYMWTGSSLWSVYEEKKE